MTVALIPARGGSKSIPLKNIKLINGKPLLFWSVKAASECGRIDRVFVCTDNSLIASAVLGFGFGNVEVTGRSPESATDTASTESVMLEFARVHSFDHIVLIQATSPLLTSNDLQNGFNVYGGSDSVLSVVEQKRFVWRQDASGFAHPCNYDYLARPRRQEFSGFLVENGAFYITSRDLLLQNKCRISGNIKTVLMPPESYAELDEPEDWEMVEALLKKRQSRLFSYDMKKRNLPGKSGDIKMLLTDCDGTLTDAGMYYTQNGEAAKKFNTRDGVGLRLLKEAGIITGIITGENSEIARERSKKLNVDEFAQGVVDKAGEIIRLCEKYKVECKNVAYIGDDLNDLPAMELCGFSACPADAAVEIRDVCDYISPLNGGHGAVRDICEYVLRARTVAIVK